MALTQTYLDFREERTRAEVLNALGRECVGWLNRGLPLETTRSAASYVEDIIVLLKVLHVYLQGRRPDEGTIRRQLRTIASYTAMAYDLLKVHDQKNAYTLFRLKGLGAELESVADKEKR